jgi:hypothetical protein
MVYAKNVQKRSLTVMPILERIDKTVRRKTGQCLRSLGIFFISSRAFSKIFEAYKSLRLNEKAYFCNIVTKITLARQENPLYFYISNRRKGYSEIRILTTIK